MNELTNGDEFRLNISFNEAEPNERSILFSSRQLHLEDMATRNQRVVSQLVVDELHLTTFDVLDKVRQPHGAVERNEMRHILDELLLRRDNCSPARFVMLPRIDAELQRLGSAVFVQDKRVFAGNRYQVVNCLRNLKQTSHFKYYSINRPFNQLP